jgi:hypothetical protein
MLNRDSYGWRMVVALSLVGCASGSKDGTGGAGGGGGNSGTVNQTHTSSQSGSNQSSTATGILDQLLDGCTRDCEKVVEVSNQLGCPPTPNCVGDCVDYGKSIGTCVDKYVALNVCVLQQMSSTSCHCGQTNGGILACDLCPKQVFDLGQCTGEGF